VSVLLQWAYIDLYVLNYTQATEKLSYSCKICLARSIILAGPIKILYSITTYANISKKLPYISHGN